VFYFVEDFKTSAISLIILITFIVKRLERGTFTRKKKFVLKENNALKAFILF